MAQTTIPVDIYDLRPATNVADQLLTVDATSGGVQFTPYDHPVTHVFYSVEAAQCRFTLDGSAPTSSNGHVLEAGDFGLLPLSWFNAIKLIRTGGSSATVHASPLTKSGQP